MGAHERERSNPYSAAAVVCLVMMSLRFLPCASCRRRPGLPSVLQWQPRGKQPDRQPQHGVARSHVSAHKHPDAQDGDSKSQVHCMLWLTVTVGCVASLPSCRCCCGCSDAGEAGSAARAAGYKLHVTLDLVTAALRLRLHDRHSCRGCSD
jgi:hypothetical protein